MPVGIGYGQGTFGRAAGRVAKKITRAGAGAAAGAAAGVAARKKRKKKKLRIGTLRRELLKQRFGSVITKSERKAVQAMTFSQLQSALKRPGSKRVRRALKGKKVRRIRKTMPIPVRMKAIGKRI